MKKDNFRRFANASAMHIISRTNRRQMFGMEGRLAFGMKY